MLYSLSRFCFTIGDVTGATAQAFLPQYYRKEKRAKAAGGRRKGWARDMWKRRRGARVGEGAAAEGQVVEKDEVEEERLVFDAAAARGTIKKGDKWFHCFPQ